MTEWAVEGIADGHLEDGTFVRTFWFWELDNALEASVRARVQGDDYSAQVPVADVESWLDAAGLSVTFAVGNYLVTMPSSYLDGILIAIYHQLKEHRNA